MFNQTDGRLEFTYSGRSVELAYEPFFLKDMGPMGRTNVRIMDIRRNRWPIRRYRHIFFTSEARLMRFAHNEEH